MRREKFIKKGKEKEVLIFKSTVLLCIVKLGFSTIFYDKCSLKYNEDSL